MRRHDLIMKVSASDRESGLGLMIVIFAATLIGAIVTTVTTMISNQTKERILLAKQAQRLVAYDFVKASLTDPMAMRISAASDNNLRVCLGLKNGTCQAGTWKNPPELRTFTLSVPLSKTFKKVDIGAKSLANNVARYDHRGRLVQGGCTPSATCQYQVLTRYWAQCPQNTKTCNGAAVRVFTIAQIVQIAPDKEGRKGFAHPKGKHLKATGSPSIPDATAAAEIYNEASFIMTTDVLSSQYMTCPHGSSLVGTTKLKTNGVPVPLNVSKCACTQGYMQTGTYASTGWPICTMQLCDANKNEVLSEIDANGEIKCEVPNAINYTCNKYSTPSTGKVTCPNGYKMRGLKSGDDCLIINHPTEGEIVDCDQMEISCCKKI